LKYFPPEANTMHRMRLNVFVAAAALFSASLAAHANSISFNESDSIYGSQSGSVSNTTGSADILFFNAAVQGADETIDLTNSSGIVTDTIFSPSGKTNPNYLSDAFEFAGIASGNSAIGTNCVASSTVACVVNTGGTINLTSDVNSQSLVGGDPGFSFWGGKLSVTANDSLPAITPEPSSFVLLGTGLLGIVGTLRRRIA
jgi:hypothetical protein